MSENKLGIQERYSIEIQEIANKLNHLENGRISEITYKKADAKLAKNIIQLRKMLYDLLYKIDNQKDSISEEFGDLLHRD
jgi:hypothetical protein